MISHDVAVMGVLGMLVPGAADNKEVISMNNHCGVVASRVIRGANCYQSGEGPVKKVRGK